MRSIQLLQFLLPVVSVLAQQVDFECFDSGSSITSCASFVSTFCNTAATLSYDAGDAASRCFNVGDGTRCDFTATNYASTTETPSSEWCELAYDVLDQLCVSTGGFGNVVFVPNTFTFAISGNDTVCPFAIPI
ncbi:hypothetical protein Clacol_002087 [Clathrus columnatus]|uniref:Glycan binding protein Y3-like domain-containing protein n=1 Tax=Clathrus columnatus TaxID=1419009 RepID=A0AAV5A5L2_9AGAM|nr:hypothetical protein Clacol_002087 [Clathrus columnatus]